MATSKDEDGKKHLHHKAVSHSSQHAPHSIESHSKTSGLDAAQHPDLLHRIGQSLEHLFEGGAKSHEATGKYQLVRSAALRTEGTHPFEAGKISLIDPAGHVVFSGAYSVGGRKKGAPPLSDAHIANHTKYNQSEKDVTLDGNCVTVPHVLRLADSDTHRVGILIHDDLNTAQSMGCYHMASNDVATLCAKWDAIPFKQKPQVLHAEKDTSHTAYSQAVAMLAGKGLHMHDGKEYESAKAPHNYAALDPTHLTR